VLRRYHRYWVAIAFLFLAAPLSIGVFFPSRTERSPDELRPLAPWPNLPTWTSNGWRTVPRAFDAYLNDHFGLRDFLVHAQALLTHLWLQSDSQFVFIGHDGWLFYRPDEMIQQSAGLLDRKSRVDETANVIAHVSKILKERGIKLIFASPPNSSTIYSEFLPGWARHKEGQTEYDLILGELMSLGVQAVDLRPALKAARSIGETYDKYDTHWTARGAIAGFNTIAATFHSDWQIDPTNFLSTPILTSGGGLARLLGLKDDLSVPTQILVMDSGNTEELSEDSVFPTFTSTLNRARGPTIMIVGDSFTQKLFPPLVLPHAKRVVWTHHRFCAFDWKWIETFQPDEIWWMPTERLMLCDHGRSPLGMPNGQFR
jgi:alginate O-acetyltransferase complex protein AlgJ